MKTYQYVAHSPSASRSGTSVSRKQNSPWLFFSALRSHLRSLREYRELEQLPDYLLDDVGLTRRQIHSARKHLPFF